MDHARFALPDALPIVPRRRRIPAFHPVPVGKRKDGWTPDRQGRFIGMLAQTGSVLAAARALGMGRESAYRLRRRPGAAGFAAAWDAALKKPHVPVKLHCSKSTGLTIVERFEAGLIQVRMYRGRFCAITWKGDDNAMLALVALRGRIAPARPRKRSPADELNSGLVVHGRGAGAITGSRSPSRTCRARSARTGGCR
jgi:hypothetical protein